MPQHPALAPGRVAVITGGASGIGREFSLEGMLESFTQRKNITVNLNVPRRQ